MTNNGHKLMKLLIILVTIILASCDNGSDNAADTASWSAWSEWTPTSNTDTSIINITQSRTRNCIVSVNGNADNPIPNCSGSTSTIETQTQTISNPLAADTASWSAWSEWTPTSNTDTSIINITQSRTRNCIVSVNGNADSPIPNCSGSTSTIETQTQTISNPLAADTASWSAWSEWTPTSNTDTSIINITQSRTRNCIVSVNGNADSPIPNCSGSTSTIETQTQTISNPLAADTASWSTWSQWSPAASNTDINLIEIVQTRIRSCEVTVIGNTDTIAAACNGSASETQTISNPLLDWVVNDFKNESIYKNYCQNPRLQADSNGEVWNDVQGASLHEKLYLRSWSNRTYLWYDEIVDVDPNDSATVAQYFNVLKSNELTNSGNPKDKFHFTANTEDYRRQATTGVAVEYGFDFAIISPTAPRSIIISDTEAGTTAFNAGVRRGFSIYSIDAALVVNGNPDILNAGLFPGAVGETHTFVFTNNTNNGATFAVVLTAEAIVSIPVKNGTTFEKVISGETKTIGYVTYNSFSSHIAETYTYSIFSEFANDNIDELVLDLRYNRGGYLYLASQLTYILAGSVQTSGKVFEELYYNNKRQPSVSPLPFYTNRIIDLVFSNVPLPELNLSRVFILSTGSTCSASESLINSLRGIDVEVILIGDTTCGKPYGFTPQDNCGTTYFTIQFGSRNAKGFEDYADGFIPSATDNAQDFVKGCTVSDDLTKVLGDQSEAMLNTALHFLTEGECPTNNQAKVITQKPNVSGAIRKPEIPGKIYLPNL